MKEPPASKADFQPTELLGRRLFQRATATLNIHHFGHGPSEWLSFRRTIIIKSLFWFCSGKKKKKKKKKKKENR